MLAQFPADILLLIFDEIDNQQDLIALALVSRCINTCVTPFAYRKYINRSKEQLKPFWPFLRTLLSKPGLGRQVRTLELRQWIPRHHLDYRAREDGSSHMLVPPQEIETYRNMLCEAPMSRNEWLAEACDSPGFYPCEAGEILALLSNTPDFQNLRLDTAIFNPRPGQQNAKIAPVITLSTLIRRINHGFLKLKNVRISAAGASDSGVVDMLAFFFRLPTMKALALSFSTEQHIPDVSQWSCAPGTSPIRRLGVALHCSQSAFTRFTDTLLASCKTLTHFHYGNRPRYGNIGKEPFSFHEFASAHAHSLVELNLLTTFAVGFVCRG